MKLLFFLGVFTLSFSQINNNVTIEAGTLNSNKYDASYALFYSFGNDYLMQFGFLGKGKILPRDQINSISASIGFPVIMDKHIHSAVYLGPAFTYPSFNEIEQLNKIGLLINGNLAFKAFEGIGFGVSSDYLVSYTKSLSLRMILMLTTN